MNELFYVDSCLGQASAFLYLAISYGFSLVGVKWIKIGGCGASIAVFRRDEIFDAC